MKKDDRQSVEQTDVKTQEEIKSQAIPEETFDVNLIAASVHINVRTRTYTVYGTVRLTLVQQQYQLKLHGFALAVSSSLSNVEVRAKINFRLREEREEVSFFS